ncbi:MAG: MHYT domain-containing protein [Cyanobacteria bacterium J06639_18]
MNYHLIDSYNLYLVTISVVIAILASYTVLKLAGRIAVAKGWLRHCWLVGGALGMGSGIWSMHFIGMLAFKAPVSIDYDFVLVLISMLPAIVASGLVLFIVSNPTIGSLELIGGSLCMGGGITTTHYLGMAAMQTPAIMHYDLTLVLISVFVAIAVSSIALFLTFQLRSESIPKRRLKQVFAAIVMGFAIASMHYTGMLALSFQPSNDIALSTFLFTTKDANLLATGVTIGTLIILGLALITTLFDRQLSAKEESHQQLKTILEGIKVGVLVIDSDSEIYMSNQAVCDLLGKTEIELRNLWETFCRNYQIQELGTFNLPEIQTVPKYDWALHEIFCAIVSSRTVDNAVMSLNKTEFEKQNWLLVNIVPQLNSDSKVEKVVCTFSDITNLKHKEEALQASEAKNRMLAEVATDQAQELEKTLNKLKLTQTQLIQQEKMSSLGQMVAGIAHEVNNPISVIYGNLTHAKKYTKDLVELLHIYQNEYPQGSPKIQAKLEEVEFDYIIEDLNKLFTSMKFGSDRMRKIVLSLRNFSRLDEATMKKVDIHEGLDNTLLLLAHRIKAEYNLPQIIIYKHYGELPQINCYAGQLNQVFKNILDNAIDALRDTFEFYDWTDEKKSFNPDKNRFLNGYTEKLLKLPSIYIYTELIDKSRIRIDIANNGPSIPESIKMRIFDPFFTTKPVGRGTGLGLSISYQIIHKHSGILECISQAGWGTKFRIELPIV